MRALLVEELLPDFGGCRLADGLAKPAPRAGEVQVKIRAAALGFPDLLMTHGGYQHKPELPFTPGTEMAGEVTALGENVTDFKIGETVGTIKKFIRHAKPNYAFPSQDKYNKYEDEIKNISCRT